MENLFLSTGERRDILKFQSAIFSNKISDSEKDCKTLSEYFPSVQILPPENHIFSSNHRNLGLGLGLSRNQTLTEHHHFPTLTPNQDQTKFQRRNCFRLSEDVSSPNQKQNKKINQEEDKDEEEEEEDRGGESQKNPFGQFKLVEEVAQKLMHIESLSSVGLLSESSSSMSSSNFSSSFSSSFEESEGNIDTETALRDFTFGENGNGNGNRNGNVNGIGFGNENGNGIENGIENRYANGNGNGNGNRNGNGCKNAIDSIGNCTMEHTKGKIKNINSTSYPSRHSLPSPCVLTDTEQDEIRACISKARNEEGVQRRIAVQKLRLISKISRNTREFMVREGSILLLVELLMCDRFKAETESESEIVTGTVTETRIRTRAKTGNRRVFQTEIEEDGIEKWKMENGTGNGTRKWVGRGFGNETETVLEDSVTALSNLAWEVDFKRPIAMAGAIPILANILISSENSVAQKSALCALCNLSAEPLNRREIKFCRILPQFIKELVKSEGKHAAMGLINMAMEEDYRQEMVEAGMIELIFSFLEQDQLLSKEGEERNCLLLSTLVKSFEACERVVKRDGIEVLGDCLERGTSRTQTYVISIFLTIALSSEKFAKVLRWEIYFPSVSAVAENHKHRAKKKASTLLKLLRGQPN